MNNNFKKIHKIIKKYPKIVIARHIGADPDAIGSQLALKEIILTNWPNKEVYAIGKYSSKFRFLGELDQVEDVSEKEKSLLIVLDTPDIKRIDEANPDEYEAVIKIDHHPFIEKFGEIEVIDDSASSTCQLITELVFATNLKINSSIAQKLYTGIISDTDRFLHPYTTIKTFKLVTKLLEKTQINFTDLYEPLYIRPLSEIRFKGYIYKNIKITDHNVAYIKITDDIIKEYGVDAASAGNLINDLKYVNEIIVWVFLTEDVKTNLIRANIRSVGPIVNDLASLYGGGGHKYASGVRLDSWTKADELIEDLNKLVRDYQSETDD